MLPRRGALPAERLEAWYRRFVETRSADAAERALASAINTADATAVADADCAVTSARALGAVGLPMVFDSVSLVTVHAPRLAKSSTITAWAGTGMTIGADAWLFALALPSGSIASTV